VAQHLPVPEPIVPELPRALEETANRGRVEGRQKREEAGGLQLRVLSDARRAAPVVEDA